jgi:hypothetical protein
VAAGIVAFDDPLIEHARQIYAEIVYTPLLLVALLALLRGFADAAVVALRLGWGQYGLGHPLSAHDGIGPTHAAPLIAVGLAPEVEGRSLYRIWPDDDGLHRAVDLPQLAHISPLPAVGRLGRALWQGSPEFYNLTQRQRN